MGEMVTIPQEEYERLLALAEDVEDAASRLPSAGLSARSAALVSMAAMTRAAAAGLRSASQAWMAARSASALRVKRTSATMAGEELPDLVLGGRVERLVVAALQLRQLVLGEVGRRGVGRDVGRDQVGEPVLLIRGERGARFVEDGVETGVHAERIAGWQGASKGRA